MVSNVLDKYKISTLIAFFEPLAIFIYGIEFNVFTSIESCVLCSLSKSVLALIQSDI